jgi:hypothetical protein
MTPPESEVSVNSLSPNATNLFAAASACLLPCSESFWTTLFGLYLLEGVEKESDSFGVNVYEHNSNTQLPPYYKLRQGSPRFVPGAISMCNVSIEPTTAKTQSFLTATCGGLNLPCFGIRPDILINGVGSQPNLTFIECKTSTDMQANQIENYTTMINGLNSRGVRCQLFLLASKGMSDVLDKQVRDLGKSLGRNFGLILWEDVLVHMIEMRFHVPGVGLNDWKKYSSLQPEVTQALVKHL